MSQTTTSGDLRDKTVDELQALLKEAKTEKHRAFVHSDHRGGTRTDFWEQNDRCKLIEAALAAKRRVQRRPK